MSTYTNDAVRANQLDKTVLDRSLGVTLGISVDVAEVTDVTGVVRGSTVGLAVRVDFAKVSRELRILSEIQTYSEVRQRCIRWCCHQRCECGSRAWRWRPGR